MVDWQLRVWLLCQPPFPPECRSVPCPGSLSAPPGQQEGGESLAAEVSGARQALAERCWFSVLMQQSCQRDPIGITEG